MKEQRSLSKRWRAVSVVAIPVIVLLGSIACRIGRHPTLPFLANVRYEIGPIYPTMDGVPERRTFYVKAPFTPVRRVLEGYEYGSGSSTSGRRYYGYGNYDSHEAWMLYHGRIQITAFPYLGDFITEPGSEESWCTILYAPPEGSGLAETIRRVL